MRRHHAHEAAHQPRIQPEHRQRKTAANNGPVYITDRGKPSYVLLTFADYQRLAANRPSIIELLAEPSGAEEIGFHTPASSEIATPAEFD